MVAVTSLIWSTDFLAVADVSRSEIVKGDILEASDMTDSESPLDYVDGESLIIDAGEGIRMFEGEVDMQGGDAFDIRFEVTNRGGNKARLKIDLYADGFDNPYDEFEIIILPGKSQKVRRTIEYYREAHPEKCSIRVFTDADTSLEIKNVDINQTKIGNGGNETIKKAAVLLRVIAAAALLYIAVYFALRAKSFVRASRKDIALYAFILLAMTLTLAILYRNADIQKPLIISGGDEMGVYYYSKIIDQNGTSLINPYSGGQTGGEMFDYPYSDKLSFACVRVIGLFSDNPYLIINIFYFSNFYIIAMVSAAVARKLGISRTSAALTGMLFALSPFIQIRYRHVWLTPYYTIAIACLLAIYVIRGTKPEETDIEKKSGLFWTGMIMAFACAFTGMYYAYFACALFAAAMVIRIVNTGGKNIKGELYPLAYIGACITGVVINIVPNLLYWQINGSNPANELALRNRSDAELYGLKLVQMILPRPGHRIELFSRIANGYIGNYPLVNENMTASLGIIASIGLLVSLLLIFSSSKRYKEISWLNYSVFIIATIGGISSIISIAVVIPMRCYNRMSLIVMFLSLLIVGMLLDQLRTRIQPILVIGLSAAMLIVGIYDQTTDYMPYDSTEYDCARQLMGQIEEVTKRGDMIYSLPYDNWPSPEIVGSYSQFIGFLETDDLHWSYGAMQGRGEAEWQKAAACCETAEMINKIKTAGYDGIYLDKSLYEEKNGEEYTAVRIEEITETLGRQPLVSDDGDKYFWKIS